MLQIAHVEHLRQMAMTARRDGRRRDAEAIELALSQLGWPAFVAPLDFGDPGQPAVPPPPPALDSSGFLHWFWSRHCGEIDWGCRVCGAPVQCLVYHSPMSHTDGLSG